MSLWLILELEKAILEQKKKSVFRYDLGECVYLIPGLYRFSFGDGLLHKYTHIQICVRTYEYPVRLLASRG